MTALVLPDANVLYSRTLRDWLLLPVFEESNMYTVHTTTDILVETLARLRDKHPLRSGSWIYDVESKICKSVHSVLKNYDPTIDALGMRTIPDEGDLHVHAAANQCGIEYLVTADTGFLDLTEEIKDQFNYEIYSPDDFFCLVDDSQPQLMANVAWKQQNYWRNKKNLGEAADCDLPRALREASCPEFAQRVQQHLAEWLTHPAPTDPRRAFQLEQP